MESNKEPFLVDIMIGEQVLTAKIDSGAGKSVIPEELYRKCLPKFKLTPVDTA